MIGFIWIQSCGGLLWVQERILEFRTRNSNFLSSWVTIRISSRNFHLDLHMFSVDWVRQEVPFRGTREVQIVLSDVWRHAWTVIQSGQYARGTPTAVSLHSKSILNESFCGVFRCETLLLWIIGRSLWRFTLSWLKMNLSLCLII
jgi:hypothetical protein